MTISTISSSSYYSQLTSNTVKNAHRSNGKSNPMSESLDSLQTALESGDTSTAQSVLSEILSHAPQSASASGNSSANSSSNPADKITGFLKQVETAISDGDTTSAQDAISSLKGYLASNPPPSPPSSGGNSAPSNPLEEALCSVQDALSSGDTSAAQNLLTEILSHAPGKNSHDGNDQASATDAESSSSPADKINSYLEELQDAVESGDTSGAQTVLTSLNDYLAANPPPQPPGVGTYSTNGTFTAACSRNGSSLSSLA